MRASAEPAETSRRSKTSGEAAGRAKNQRFGVTSAREDGLRGASKRRTRGDQPVKQDQRAAPEQLGAAASTGDTARAEEAQAAPERASQELGKTQRAALRKQERLRPRRAPRPPPRTASEQQEAAADPGETAGAEEREEPVLSDPDQRASKMDLRRKLAALLESEGIGKSGRKNRLIAALSQMMESMDQPAPDLGSKVPTVAVGVLRAEEPEDESQWRCKVTTCSGSYHPLIKCLPFLQMPAEERGELVALSDLCRGCLTRGHSTTVRACPFRDELDGLCAKPKCKRAHHQLLHVYGKQSRCPHQYLGGDADVSKQRYAQAAATMVHSVHQPPVQLVAQRIRTAAGKSCLAFWDNGSQVTLTTHKAAREMGLEPIPGPPLNLMGVGDSRKTRSTVRYKVPLVDTRGQTVEVAAYGMDHIMAPLEAVSPRWMRAAFPEAPTGGLEAASGRFDLLIGQPQIVPSGV